MRMSDKVLLRPFVELAGLFMSGADTPRHFLERGLERLEAYEPEIGAFVILNIEGARAAADKADTRWREGRPLSPIDGMPIGIKDVIETVDMPTQFGSPLMAGWQSHKDAASVAALRASGAVILGKTVTTEFAMSFPRGTRNPHDLLRTPGGSSSGSAAAVAAGIISAGLGTQVIGSVLRPASFCGIFGYKPTVHGLNRIGSHDYQSQSCNGILAASLADAWQVAIEIANRAGGDPGWPGIVGPERLPPPRKPTRLAFIETAGWGGAGDAAKAAFATACARPKSDGIEILTRRNHAIVDSLEPDIADAFNLSMKINDWEMRWFIRTLADRDIEKLSPIVRTRMVDAAKMTRAEYIEAIALRDAIRGSYAELAADCDGCLTLTAAGAAPLGLESTGSPQFTVPASLLGVPALSLPLLRDNDLPLGLQLIGFADRDADAFAVGSYLDSVLAPA
jgi:Asp-tRNA(Asn)/Glu-tRNA(Gln) amidotransferase A subunit family amidase